jgi:hypothetical protein
LASCIGVGFIYNAAAQNIKVEELEMDLEGDIDLACIPWIVGKQTARVRKHSFEL